MKGISSHLQFKQDKANLSEYFGALREDPVLDRLEADSKRIREMARSRV